MIDPQHLRALEQKNGLPAGLLSAVMQQESGGNPNAVSPKGATGLFQFMPDTAKAYGIDPLDPMQSADGAARMYGDLSKQFNGDLASMLAAYNWGSGNLQKQGLANAPAETQNYIKSITSALPQYAQGAAQTMTDAVVEDIPPPPAGFDLPAPPEGFDSEAPPPPAGFDLAEPPAKAELFSDDPSLLESTIKDIPRQLGLTGRYIAEGVASIGDLANMAINAVGQPFGMSPLGMPSQTIGNALTKIGVPQPRGSLERVVGDASRALVSTATGVGAGKSAPALAALADNPLMQAKAAIGSSAAAGATREAGGSELAQLAAALGGGVAAAKTSIPKKEVYTVNDVKKLSNAAYEQADRLGGQLTPRFVDNFISEAQKVTPQTAAGKLLAGESPVTRFAERLKGLAGKPLSLKEAQEVYELMGDEIDAFVQPNGMLNKQGKKMLDIQNAFREAIEKPQPGDMVNKAGFDAWQKGSKLWSKAMKLNDVERIIMRSELSDNPASTIRSGFKTLASNPKKLRGFSKDEISAIRRAAKSGLVDEALRFAGSRLLPIVGAGSGNLSAVMGVPAGMAAREGGALLQLRRAGKVAEKIAGVKPRNKSPAVRASALGTLYGNSQ